jgi:adenosylmethionine-8-amino-7-oxononanoate aminotransferase
VGDDGFGADIFNPLRFPVVRAPAFDDPACFDTAIALIAEHASDLAAVIGEPSVQAAAGMQLADLGGLERLGRACLEYDVLLICDEIATGFGRTGTLFASEACNLRPDLLCLGKGLTAGYLPMSVTAASGPVFEAFLGDDLGENTLYHGHSFGGNALAAAVALRHLELIDAWDVLANVRERSDELAGLLHDRIGAKPAVREIRLRGLMGAVELAPPTEGLKWGRRVSAGAVDRGVLLRSIGDNVTLMPPLTITSQELHRIVHALSESIDGVDDVDGVDGARGRT